MTQPDDEQREAARVRKRQLLTDATDDGLQVIEVPGLGHLIPDPELDENGRLMLAQFIEEMRTRKADKSNGE